MSRTKRFFFVGLVATLGLGGVALAKGGHAGGPFMEVIRGLELSEDQKAEAEAIREAARAEREAAGAARAEFMDLVLEELASGQPDRKAIARAETELHEAMVAAASARTEALLDFYDTLDPAQRQELVDGLTALREQHQARMEAHGEGGRHGGPR